MDRLGPAVLIVLWALPLRAAERSCGVTEQGVDLAGNDCCGGKQTLASAEACCAACQQKESDGCRFWTYAASLKHCYLKSSDAGRTSRSSHVSGSLSPSPAPKPPSPAPTPSCPKVPEPPSSHPPLPAGQYRFPYNMGDLIIHDAGDGCPDIDINRFDNGAEKCPSIWQKECRATKGSDEDPTACKCGSPLDGGKAQAGCHQCIGQPHRLERKPANVTAYKAKDVCGRYPPITRRQMIERALGWVSNGFLYGRWNKTSGGGTPETCGSEDETECPQYSYESVCNGLLEMAWKSDDTNTGPGKKKSWPPNKIDCLDVKPGDWLHTGHHMQMFRRWVNGSGYGKKMVLYQMGGGWGKANAAVVSFNKGPTDKKYFPCYRRPNIIGDEHESDGHYCSTHSATTLIV